MNMIFKNTFRRAIFDNPLSRTTHEATAGLRRLKGALSHFVPFLAPRKGGLLLARLGQETVFDMRDALYRKVHDLGLDYHGARRTGDTITRVTSDVKEVRSLLVDSVVEVGSSFLILIGMLVVMLWMSPSLTALALVTVPFLFLAVRRYRQALIERMRVVRAKEGAIASVIQEAVTGIRAVKIFARER